MIAPLFDEMSEEFSDSCIFVKVDVDEAPEISAQHQVLLYLVHDFSFMF